MRLIDFKKYSACVLIIPRYRPREYDSEDGPWDPISGGASALLGTIGSLMMGFADFPVEILKALKIKPPERSEVGEKAKAKATEQAEATEQADATTGGKSAGNTTNQNESVNEEVPPSGSAVTSDVYYPNSSAPGPHGNSLAQALNGHIRRPSLNKRPSSDTGSQKSKQGSREASPHGTRISLEAALGAGKGVGRIVETGLKSPMDFTLGLARGFHNAPKLYGDESVRTPEKITGFQSGLKAAGKVCETTSRRS